MVTDRAQAAAAGHHLLDVIARVIDAGGHTVLLREKDLPTPERSALARALAELLTPVDGALLVACDAHLAETVGATGVHLAADETYDCGTGRAAAHAPTPSRRHLAGGGPNAEGPSHRRGPSEMEACRFVVGRSCHSVGELRAAQAAGVDYVTFSPVWATASKPGYGPALGVDGLAKGVEAVPGLPVYALGGIEPGRAADCQAAGAAGVAVMGAVMGAVGPASVVRHLLAELTPNEDA